MILSTCLKTEMITHQYLTNLLAIFSAAWSARLFPPTLGGVQVYADIAAETAISQYWHDARTLIPQAHPNLQNDLAWYIVGNLEDHPQISLARVIAHQASHPEVSG